MFEATYEHTHSKTFQLGKNTEQELSKGSNGNRDFQVLEIN